jgi:hypothetical protein
MELLNNINSVKVSAMDKDIEIKWMADVEDKDYPAAQSYLSLLHTDTEVIGLVKKLKDAKIVTFKAKDIFRASGLSLLGVSNSHVDKDQKKIKEGTPLSPLLLIRDVQNGKLIIADGYHRLCAVYTVNEDASIPCKIV